MDSAAAINLRRLNPTGYGWSMVVVVLMLCAVGLSCIFAAEVGAARGQDAVPTHTVKQAVFVLAGLLAMAVVCSMNYRRYGRYAYPIFGFMLVLLALLLVARFVPLDPVMPKIRGVCRWIANARRSGLRGTSRTTCTESAG